MVLVMTPNAMKSEVVRKEWRYARQRGVCVYPVKGAPDLDFASLPKWMRDSHFYDLGYALDRLEVGPEWKKFTNDLNTRCETPHVPFMVEDLPPDFVMRSDEYDKLIAELLDAERENPVAITAALRGAGGYGKTTLARAICHDERVQQAFDDGILWVTLGEKLSENDLYNRVIGLTFALKGEPSKAPTLDTAIAELVDLLADRDVLLVIDDVWERAHLRPFLQGGKGCARLITTRYADKLPENVHDIRVDAMKQNEAVKLLLAGVSHTATPAVSALAKRLGDWPLLLKLANSVLREQMRLGRTFEQALDYVDRALTKRGLTAFDAENPESRKDAVAKTLDITLDLLDAKRRERFNELAIFPDDVDVPLATLERFWANTAGLDDFETEDLCRLLYNRSLLLDLNLQTRTLRLHDVIRQYLIDGQRAEMPRLQARFLDAHKPADGWHALPANEPYLWRYLAYHLKAAGRLEELRTALLDYRYLQAKLNATDPNALIADCDGWLEDAGLRLIKSAVSMSAHLINEDREGWAHQLVGRLMIHRRNHAEIRRLVDEIVAHVPGLYPVDLDSDYACLEQAGGPLIRTLTGHTDSVRHVAVTGDGRAISASADGTLRVWEVATGACLHTLTGHTDWVNHVAVTGDGRAISASDDGTLRVWEVATGACLHTLTGHTDRVNHVAVTGDGRAISASADGTLRVWEVATGACLHTLTGHTDRVNHVAVTGDGRAISASADGTLRVWEVATGACLHTLTGHTFGVNHVAVTGDGRAISASDDGTLRVWEVATGACLHTLTGHTSWVLHVAVTGDGRAISASKDRTLRVWDIDAGRLLGTFPITPEGRIDLLRKFPTATVFEGFERHPNRRGLSRTGRCIIVHAADGTPLAWFGGDANILSAAWSPDGRYIVAGDDAGQVLLLRWMGA
jgi:WD40 repeat protein